MGSHATVVETTREVISDRRLSAVRALGHELSGSTTINLFGRVSFAGESLIPAEPTPPTLHPSPIVRRLTKVTASNMPKTMFLWHRSTE